MDLLAPFTTATLFIDAPPMPRAVFRPLESFLRVDYVLFMMDEKNRPLPPDVLLMVVRGLNVHSYLLFSNSTSIVFLSLLGLINSIFF